MFNISDPPAWLKAAAWILGACWALVGALASLWPLFTDKTIPAWLADKGWLRLTALFKGWPYWSVSIAIVLLLVGVLFIQRQPVVSRDMATLGADIDKWSKVFGHSAGPIAPEDGDSFFSIVTTLNTGVKVTTKRTKKLPTYLSLIVNLQLGGEVQDAFGKLDDAAKSRVIDELKLELSRVKIDYVISPPLKAVGLVVVLPITDSLGADAFLEAIRTLDAGSRLTLVFIKLHLGIKQ